MASQLVPTTFQYVAERDHESVLIKGSWDRWQSFAALQRADDDPNLWQVRMHLSPGTVLFKFVVDNEWVFAPNYKHISDGFGGMNNELHIELPEEKRTASSIPSTYASIADVTGVDVHHQSEQLQVPPAHHSPEETPLDEHEQSETRAPVKQQADKAMQNGAPSEDTAQHVQPVESLLPTREITFKYPTDQLHQNVSVKGSWDAWATSSPLLLSEQDDAWSAVIELPAGNFFCKFIVDDQWTHSPLYEIQSDGFGGFNNVINVPTSDSFVGDTCQFYDALDSVLEPQQAVLEHETLSVEEKEDVHPVEELNNNKVEGNSITSPPLQAEETAEEQSVGEPEIKILNASEQEPSDNQEPALDSSDAPEEPEPSLLVPEVEQKLEAEDGSIDGEAYTAKTPDTPETEQAERTIEMLAAEAPGDNYDMRSPSPALKSLLPAEDLDASSEELFEAVQAENPTSDKLADMADVLEEIVNEDGRSATQEKNGCIIC